MRPPILAFNLCLAGVVLLSITFYCSSGVGWASPDPSGAELLSVSANSRLGVDHISAINQQYATYSEPRYQRAADIYARWNRWVFYWHEIETSNNVYNYEPQSRVASEDVKHGLQTEAILMGTPGWCTTASMAALTAPAPPPRVGQKRYGPGQLEAMVEAFSGPSPATYPPSNLYEPVFNGGDLNRSGGINKNNHWADFVYETVSRFKDKIKYWEIWNEPDFYPNAQHNWFGFWYGTPEQYYRLLKVAYLAAKYADPQATIIMGGMAYWPDQQVYTGRPDFSFVPRVLDAAKADPSAQANNYYFDVTAWHWYNRSSQMYDMVNYTRSVMASKGFGSKPYWVNECGSPAWNDPARPPFGGPNEKYFGSSTMDEQASYVIQAIAYGLAAGVDKIFIFQHYDDYGAEAFGLRRDDDSARPQYAAYKQAATYFRDITSIRLDSQGSARLVTACTSTNQRIIALWNVSPVATTARVQAQAASALKVTQPTVSNLNGRTETIYPSGGYYSIPLPGATCQLDQDVRDDYIIGGMTYILVETGVSGPTPTPTPGPLPTGLITNGDFELTSSLANSSQSGWLTSGSTVPQITSAAYRGQRAAILGQNFTADPDPALQGGGNSTLSQAVALPSSAPDLSLDFAFTTNTTQSPPSDPGNKFTYDFFEVLLFDSSGARHDLFTYVPSNGSSGWQMQSVDLSQWRGQTVWICFNLWQSSASYPSTATVDAVSIWPYKTHLPIVQRNSSS